MRGTRVTITLFFFLDGLLIGSWAARIPAVQRQAELTNAQLGLALFAASLGALAGMPLAGWLCERIGSRRVTVGALLGGGASLFLASVATGLVWLTAALFAFGAGFGTINVSANAQGLALERLRGRSTLSSFHAAFSGGGLAGAGLGALAAGLGTTPRLHFGALVLMLTVGGLAAGRRLLPPDADDPAPTRVLVRPSRAVLVLGAAAFFTLLAEGAAADWSAVYLAHSLGATAAVAALGYTGFSLSMAITRAVGDRLNERVGPVALTRGGGLLAAGGLTFALVGGSPPVALGGFAAMGAGLGVVVPVLFRAAGSTPGVSASAGVAAVSTLGWLGFLAGPPAIGLAAGAVGLRGALGLVVLATVALALLARSAGPHRRAEFHGLVFEPRAVLSDMDGVLVDSGVAIEYTWRGFAARHQLDPERVLALVHGRRPVDLIRLVAPHLDADAEAARIEREEIASAAVLRPLPGARELVEVVPAERFAIVTSASRALALARLRAAGIPAPEVLVTAEQVQDGKPDPAGYLSAAQLLGVDPVHCLVLEDAPAGVDAGLAAGMTVIGVLTTNNESSLRRANSRVPDLRALLPKADGPRRRSRPSGTPPPEHDEASQRTPRPADKPCAARLLGSALSDLEHARRSRRAVLHGQEGSEERDSATCRYRGQLGARLTKEFAGSRSCRKDRFVEVANVRAVLDDRLGVPVSLVDDALGLIVVEVDLILQRSGVLGPHDVHGLRGQALELLDLPLVKLEPGDTFYLSQLLRPSSRLRSGEMRRQELSGSVQRRAGFVEDRIKGLEDVRHPGGDVEGDLDVGGGGLAGEADGVVEENLVRSGLDDQGRQAGQVGEDGADEAESGSCPAV